MTNASEPGINRSVYDGRLLVCLPSSATPVLVIQAGQVDVDPGLIPFAGDHNWPVVYWSNGTVTGGLEP